MNSKTLKGKLHRIIDFYNDEDYFRRLFTIAYPIALQQFIFSLLNMVGVMMVGQLGDTSVAALGLANQIFFLLQLLLFGINSGAAIFTAQLWGKRDIPNIRKVLGLALLVGLVSSCIFTIIAVFFPDIALSVYTKDPAVVMVGSGYLRIFGWGYFATAITFCYASILRSVGDVKTPTIVSITALCLNTILSYGLILGHFGLPALGVSGAAIASLIARTLECLILLLITYKRHSPAAARISEMLKIDPIFAKNVLWRVLPVALNELLWSLGITTYNIVYARIGTDAIAAMNIASTVEGLANVVFMSISTACAIMVGHQIGANEKEKAFRYAGRSISIGMLGAVMVGGLIIISSRFILSFYKVSPIVIQYTQNILTVMACFLWLRSSNMILFIGALRSGGDIRFAFFIDAGFIWIVGVPMAFLGAFVFHLPIYWVYVMVMSDEFTKWLFAMVRFFSKKWIHNLTQIA